MTNIIEILIGQHNKLKEILVTTKEIANSGEKNYKEIVKKQDEFTEKLTMHLELENNTFYPCLLAGWKKKNAPETVIANKKMFVLEMKKIELEVHEFLNKYKTVEKLEEHWKSYPDDLKMLINTLVFRVETEEDGIYMEWEIVGSQECLDEKSK